VCDTSGTPVWQPNYYEHIVRSEKDCNRICEYIQYNPQNWKTDEENQ
jgi:putative transposase